MKKTVLSLIVILCQIAIVVFFFGIVFRNGAILEEHVSIVHNGNLDKIATSVSLLFKEEVFESSEPVIIDETVVEELPSLDGESSEEVNETVNLADDSSVSETVPLVSIDADKYTGNERMGFVVTEGNKQYDLSGYEFDVVVAVVAGEFDKNLDDALAVVSVILNRCDSAKWSSWAGSSPYSQVIRAGQFEVYFAGLYLPYMPGGSRYGDSKYVIAKQAVIDGLNGIRNNNYLGFRAWHVSTYSDKYIVHGGNRYGYN